MQKTDKVKITEGVITDALHFNFLKNSKYKLSNAFIFRHNWESDFFVVNPNGFSYEFEVKISRADFRNDKKKVTKHEILQTGEYSSKSYKERTCPETGKRITDEVFTKHPNIRPNRFYYVVPENLISVDEIPDYAGLYYFYPEEYGKSKLKKIKEAPQLHKERVDFSKILCSKFYYYWLDKQLENSMLRRRIKQLEDKLTKKSETIL